MKRERKMSQSSARRAFVGAQVRSDWDSGHRQKKLELSGLGKYRGMEAEGRQA